LGNHSLNLGDWWHFFICAGAFILERLQMREFESTRRWLKQKTLGLISDT